MNIKRAKDFCRSLPGVTEDIKWTDHLARISELKKLLAKN